MESVFFSCFVNVRGMGQEKGIRQAMSMKTGVTVELYSWSIRADELDRRYGTTRKTGAGDRNAARESLPHRIHGNR